MKDKTDGQNQTRRWGGASNSPQLRGEAEQLDPDTFARERLGWWSPVRTEQVDHAIDKDAWNKCASDDTKPEGKTAYGVKFAADGSAVCLCGAVIPKDDPARISLIELQPGGAALRGLPTG